MRHLTVAAALLLAAACSKPEPQPADAAGAGAAAAITTEAIAGKWTMSTSTATSDSVILTFEMNAVGDPSTWTFNFPNRPPVPLRVTSVAGDSIMTEAGPYESALRPGVQVTTNSVMRLENGELVGQTVAHYAGGGADTVLHLRTRGVRAP